MRKIKALLASRMEVIGDVLDSDELWLAAKGTDADMVIVMLLDANGDPHVCTQMLKAYPHSRIVAQLKPVKPCIYTNRVSTRLASMNASNGRILANQIHGGREL